MIARRLEPELERPLSLLLTLHADGTAETISDAQDSAEHAEALRRLRAWCAGAAVDALLSGVEGGGH